MQTLRDLRAVSSGQSPGRRPPPSAASRAGTKGPPGLSNSPGPTCAVGSPSAAVRGGTGGAFALPRPPEPTGAVGSPDASRSALCGAGAGQGARGDHRAPHPARSGPPSLPPKGRRAGRTGLSVACASRSSGPARAPRAPAAPVATGRRDRGRTIAAVFVFDVLDRGGSGRSLRFCGRHHRRVCNRQFRGRQVPILRPLRRTAGSTDLHGSVTGLCIPVTIRLALTARPPERDRTGRAGPREGVHSMDVHPTDVDRADVDRANGVRQIPHSEGASARRTGG